jgi:NAD-dependent SIR2 family protein deacetylase
MLTRSFCELADLLDGQRVLVLSGAGCSTESGIPDYRGPDSQEKVRRPILYQEFVRDPVARRRYWARSAVGWRRVASARPNAGHQALASMEKAGLVRGIVTQNVDGLHQAAGSDRVVELHGNLADAAESAPDGDVELSAGVERSFRVASCLRCGGILKPAVVFFGENVPKEKVEASWELFERADVLLVVGSSLTVFSGFRFIRKAEQRKVPVAIVNLGDTRGDDVARVKVTGRTGEVLPALADALL